MAIREKPIDATVNDGKITIRTTISTPHYGESPVSTMYDDLANVSQIAGEIGGSFKIKEINGKVGWELLRRTSIRNHKPLSSIPVNKMSESDKTYVEQIARVFSSYLACMSALSATLRVRSADKSNHMPDNAVITLTAEENGNDAVISLSVFMYNEYTDKFQM
jgi:hypothetical protein